MSVDVTFEAIRKTDGVPYLEDCLEFLKRDDADNFSYFIQIS
jgi:hypothetical protein